MNKRIELILKTKNISASKFADEIGVQRSSISHILSGRNNPSLDFIQKTLKRFPDINSSWILTGSGTMYNSPNLFSSEIEYKEENIMDRIINEPVVEHNSESTNITKENKEEEYNKHEEEEEVKQVNHFKKKAPFDAVHDVEATYYGSNRSRKKIERIIIFYDDKSYKEYHPE